MAEEAIANYLRLVATTPIGKGWIANATDGLAIGMSLDALREHVEEAHLIYRREIEAAASAPFDCWLTAVNTIMAAAPLAPGSHSPFTTTSECYHVTTLRCLMEHHLQEVQPRENPLDRYLLQDFNLDANEPDRFFGEVLDDLQAFLGATHLHGFSLQSDARLGWGRLWVTPDEPPDSGTTATGGNALRDLLALPRQPQIDGRVLSNELPDLAMFVFRIAGRTDPSLGFRPSVCDGASDRFRVAFDGDADADGEAHTDYGRTLHLGKLASDDPIVDGMREAVRLPVRLEEDMLAGLRCPGVVTTRYRSGRDDCPADASYARKVLRTRDAEQLVEHLVDRLWPRNRP